MSQTLAGVVLVGLKRTKSLAVSSTVISTTSGPFSNKQMEGSQIQLLRGCIKLRRVRRSYWGSVSRALDAKHISLSKAAWRVELCSDGNAAIAVDRNCDVTLTCSLKYRGLSI